MADYEYRVQAVEDFGTSEGVPIEAAVEAAINQNARDGWHFMRIDTVTSGNPSRVWAERKSVMIFRRVVAAVKEQPPLVLTKPVFVDQQSKKSVPIPATDPSPRPTIEAAVNGARGGFSHGQTADAEGRSERPLFQRDPRDVTALKVAPGA